MDTIAKHLPGQFIETANRLKNKVALRQKKFGIWHDLTWGEYLEQARTMAQGLMELGLRKGDFVGILGENCAEWVIVDMAVQMAGGTVVGIYATSSWKQVQYIVNHSDCKFLFAENEEQVDKWLEMREGSPQLEKVIYWEEKGLREVNDPQLMEYHEIMEMGKAPEAKDPERLDAITASIKAEDIAILVYTSGTTGPPKGAMLTQGNLAWMGHAVQQIDPGMTVRENDEVMSFLPLCHIFERLFSVIVHVSLGYTVNFVESLETVPQNLREISPTIGYAVPRIWEKYYSTIVIRMSDAKPIKRAVYALALKLGMAHAEAKLLGDGPSTLQTIGFHLAQITVFHWLRKRMGMDRMRFAFSGAAPISPDVLKFFHAIGVKVIEGYGQTESGGISTAAKVDEFRLGTVGKTIPGGEVKIAEDGEILVKTPGVFAGYYKNPEATASTVQGEWLHSGDIGEMDEAGYIKIVDRKKDLIITAGGKNIAPQYIENKLKFSPYINDAIVIGDRRKYITAIIVLDEDNVNKFAQDQKIPYSTYSDLAQHPDIQKLVDDEVQKVNKQLARVESVRKFTILDKKLYEEDGEVTPTMKVKRKFINEAYKKEIEGMY